MIAGLDHVTINTGDLAATERFYVDVVGLELAPRPNLGVPGIWLRSKDGGQAIVHVLAVDDVQPANTGAARPSVDHVAFHARGFAEARSRVEGAGLEWRGNIIADFGLYQLMFSDPNGVLVELNFKAVDEIGEVPVIPQAHAFT